jgi:hypothetical protein
VRVDVVMLRLHRCEERSRRRSVFDTDSKRHRVDEEADDRVRAFELGRTSRDHHSEGDII